MCKKISQGILQFFQFIIAILLLGVGGFAIYAGFIFKDLDVVDLVQENDEQKGVGELISNLLYFAGAGVVVYGIFSIVAILCTNKIIAVIYLIMSVIIFSAFLAIGIGSLYTYSNFQNADQVIPDQFGKACDKDEQGSLSSANEAYLAASNFLCGVNCPCKIPDTSTWSAEEISGWQIDIDGVDNIYDCKTCTSQSGSSCSEDELKSTFNDYFSDYEKYFDLLELAENKWDCAGICEQPEPNKYVFTVVGRGKPEKSCINKLED